MTRGPKARATIAQPNLKIAYGASLSPLASEAVST